MLRKCFSLSSCYYCLGCNLAVLINSCYLLVWKCKTNCATCPLDNCFFVQSTGTTFASIWEGLNAHLRAFSPIIIIEDHIYRLLFTHSPEITLWKWNMAVPQIMKTDSLYTCFLYVSYNLMLHIRLCKPKYSFIWHNPI